MHNRIKELRAKHGFTQQDLAKKVNVRRETIIFQLNIEDVFIFPD